MNDKNFINNVIPPMINFLKNWKFEKEQEGLIPTVELLLEELNQNNEQRNYNNQTSNSTGK